MRRVCTRGRHHVRLHGDRTDSARHASLRRIVVDVRLERIGDENAEPRGRRQIGVEIPVGVNEKRDTRLGVGDEIARMPQARVEELLDQQLARTLRASFYGRGC